MKIFHLALPDERIAEDFCKALDKGPQHTDDQITDAILAELSEQIKKEFDLDR